MIAGKPRKLVGMGLQAICEMGNDRWSSPWDPTDSPWGQRKVFHFSNENKTDFCELTDVDVGEQKNGHKNKNEQIPVLFFNNKRLKNKVSVTDFNT